jgi:hypothetical protein
MPNPSGVLYHGELLGEAVMAGKDLEMGASEFVRVTQGYRTF